MASVATLATGSEGFAFERRVGSAGACLDHEAARRGRLHGRREGHAHRAVRAGIQGRGKRSATAA